MKNTLPLIVTIGFLSMLSALGRPHVPSRESGHVVVRFNETKVKRVITRLERDPLRKLLLQLKLPAGARLEETQFTKWSKNKGRRKNLRVVPDIDYSSAMYLRLPPGLTPEQCVKLLEKHPLIEHLDIDPIGTGGITPTDPDANDQWHHTPYFTWHRHINATQAWDITTGTSDVIVAVLDSGINTNLAEFTGRLVEGYNFVEPGSPPNDDHGHGTQVAGVLGANANNATNGAGIDWNCKIMPIRVLSNNMGQAVGSYFQWAQGVNWAVSNNAKIINMSFGGTTQSYLFLEEAISNAVANGVIVISVTHNYNTNTLYFPGSMPETIALGATAISGKRWTNSPSLGSNFGTNIDLVAPGEDIWTVTTSGIWTNYSGTSFAAPMASGVAALMCSINPDLNNEDVRALLCAGAVDQDHFITDTNDLPGYDLHFGWGRLNAYNSVLLSMTTLDHVSATNGGQVVMSWPCPPNAYTNEPYRIEYASSPTNSWTETNASIVYSSDHATWTDVYAAGLTSRYYRVRLKEF